MTNISLAAAAAPFIELTKFLCSNSAASHRGVLDILAHKVQFPEDPQPTALMLLGPPGAGKTLWCDIVQRAFGPAGRGITVADLRSPFNAWVEGAQLVNLNGDGLGEAPTLNYKLKALIAENTAMVNAKGTPTKIVQSNALYLIDTQHGVNLSLSIGTRLVRVIQTPNRRETEFYELVGAWLDNGGAKAVYEYLLNRTLTEQTLMALKGTGSPHLQ